MLLLVSSLVVLTTLKDVVAKFQDRRPIDYQFVCEYLTVGTKGEILGKKKIRGTYHISDKLRWSGIAIADATGEHDYRPEKDQEFMNGFTYSFDQIKEDGTEAFFGKIPAQAVECRNLVWDTHMFEGFAYDHLGELRMNDPVTISRDKNSPLASAGSFHDRNVNLTWIG